MLITNARSLLPKIDSLVDAIQSLDLHLACITETWFRGGRALSDRLDELEDDKGIRIIHKSRDSRRKKAGGGVAIAFNPSTCNFRKRHLKNMEKGWEVVCAVGRIAKTPRKVFVFAVYIPPNIKAAEFCALAESLAVEVAEIKATLNSPAVFICGDMNRRDLRPYLNMVEYFTQLDTPPTR